MQYQVPQFIEIEDKIFGRLTFKQFVYLVGGGAISYMSYRFMIFPFYLLVAIPMLSFSLALAFYKVNNRPFIDMVESAVKFFLQAKLYIWNKKEKEIKKATALPTSNNTMYIPKLSDSKLRDLTWSLDIHETIYSKDDDKLMARSELPNNYRNEEGELEAFKGLGSFKNNRQNR